MHDPTLATSEWLRYSQLARQQAQRAAAHRLKEGATGSMFHRNQADKWERDAATSQKRADEWRARLPPDDLTRIGMLILKRG